MSRVIKSLAKETLFYGLSYSLSRLLNFILVTTYLTYKVFTKQDGSLAIFQDIYFYIALLLGLLTLRMETSLFRFISNKDDEHSGIYSLLSQWVWIACTLFVFIYFIFKDFILNILSYPKDFENCVFIALMILILDVITSLPYALLRFNQQILRYSWIKLIGVIIHIAMVFYFFEFYFKPEEIVSLDSSIKILYILVANLTSSICVVIFLLPQIRLGFYKANWSLSKTLFHYCWPLILITFMYTIIQNGYTTFLKYLLPGTYLTNLSNSDSLVAVGRLAVIMNIFVTAFNYGAEPFFFRHSKENNAKENYAKLNLFFVVACCVVYILSCTNAHLIGHLIGPGFRDALYLLPVLLLANIFSGIYTNLSSWYKLTDHTKMAAGISLIGLVINVILFIFLTPLLGINAAAWIALFVYVIMCILSVWQGNKYYPIPYQHGKTLMYLVFSVLISYLHSTYIHVALVSNIALSVLYVTVMLIYVYRNDWIKK